MLNFHNKQSVAFGTGLWRGKMTDAGYTVGELVTGDTGIAVRACYEALRPICG